MIIGYKSTYKKAYKKLSSQNKLLADKAIELFINNPFDPRLKNHKLKGKLEGIRSISAANDLRILYEESGNNITVLMVNIGTHSQVY